MEKEQRALSPPPTVFFSCDCVASFLVCLFPFVTQFGNPYMGSASVQAEAPLPVSSEQLLEGAGSDALILVPC